MKYLSLCSGIECASVAWAGLGWEPVAFSEIDPFPSSVLAARFPGVPNLGDMNGYEAWDIERPDIIVAGTPCVSFSVAGLRQGLLDGRGGLTLTLARICERYRPGFVLWENVPGVLSSRDNAFGCLLGALAGEDSQLEPPGKRWADAGLVLGPERTVAWRCLDAQFFGLAQRRRRVFVLACPRHGADPARILFEPGCTCRDAPEGRPDAEDPGPTPARCPLCGLAPRRDSPPVRPPAHPATLAVDVYNLAVDGDVSCTVTSATAGTNTSGPKALAPDGTLRRLTAEECERLQGFPAGWTDVPGASHARRVKAVGNSMAVPCMRHIGERIASGCAT